MENTSLLPPSDDDDYVRRMNETIAIRPQRGKLTLVVRRLFNVLVYFAQQDGPQAKYSRPLNEIMAMVEFSSGATSVIKHHLELMAAGIAVIWNKPGEAPGWGVTGMLAQAELDDGPRGTPKTLSWMFPEKIQQRLFEYDAFTRLSLQIHTSLTSGASVSLFEICSRYETNNGKKRDGSPGLTNSAPWEWWVPVLTGDPTNTYSEYKYFKRDILKASIREINAQEKAPFTVELVEKKLGIRIDTIQFKVTPKKPGEGQGDGYDWSPDVDLLGRMIAIGIPQDEARAICRKHDRKAVLKALNGTQKRAASTSENPLVNLPAYFKALLRSKYRDVSAPVKPAQQGSLDLPDPAAELQKLKASYATKQCADALKYWKEIPSTDALDLIDEFLSTDLPKPVRDGIKKRVCTTKISETAFGMWIAAKLWGEPTSDELLAFSLK